MATAEEQQGHQTAEPTRQELMDRYPGLPYMGRHFYELVESGKFIPGVDFCVEPALSMDTIDYLEVEEGECVENALRRRFGVPLQDEARTTLDRNR